jgi:Ran GTPase-activating protein (RanGAP) involved in mRNA processing and transport
VLAGQHISEEEIRFPSLKELAINSCQMRADNFAKLSSGIASSDLERLSLKRVGINALHTEGVALLFTASQNSSSCLRSIDLSQNDLSKVVFSLSEALAGNTTLRQLFLMEARLNSDGAQSLFSSLRENKPLQVLKLNGNTLYTGNPTDIALTYSIRDTLTLNKSLRVLSLK